MASNYNNTKADSNHRRPRSACAAEDRQLKKNLGSRNSSRQSSRSSPEITSRGKAILKNQSNGEKPQKKCVNFNMYNSSARPSSRPKICEKKRNEPTNQMVETVDKRPWCEILNRKCPTKLNTIKINGTESPNQSPAKIRPSQESFQIFKLIAQNCSKTTNSGSETHVGETTQGLIDHFQSLFEHFKNQAATFEEKEFLQIEQDRFKLLLSKMKPSGMTAKNVLFQFANRTEKTNEAEMEVENSSETFSVFNVLSGSTPSSSTFVVDEENLGTKEEKSKRKNSFSRKSVSATTFVFEDSMSKKDEIKEILMDSKNVYKSKENSLLEIRESKTEPAMHRNENPDDNMEYLKAVLIEDLEENSSEDRTPHSFMPVLKLSPTQNITRDPLNETGQQDKDLQQFESKLGGFNVLGVFSEKVKKMPMQADTKTMSDLREPVNKDEKGDDSVKKLFMALVSTEDKPEEELYNEGPSTSRRAIKEVFQSKQYLTHTDPKLQSELYGDLSVPLVDSSVSQETQTSDLELGNCNTTEEIFRKKWKQRLLKRNKAVKKKAKMETKPKDIKNNKQKEEKKEKEEVEGNPTKIVITDVSLLNGELKVKIEPEKSSSFHKKEIVSLPENNSCSFSHTEDPFHQLETSSSDIEKNPQMKISSDSQSSSKALRAIGGECLQKLPSLKEPTSGWVQDLLSWIASNVNNVVILQEARGVCDKQSLKLQEIPSCPSESSGKDTEGLLQRIETNIQEIKKAFTNFSGCPLENSTQKTMESKSTETDPIEFELNETENKKDLKMFKSETKSIDFEFPSKKVIKLSPELKRSKGKLSKQNSEMDSQARLASLSETELIKRFRKRCKNKKIQTLTKTTANVACQAIPTTMRTAHGSFSRRSKSSEKINSRHEADKDHSKRIGENERENDRGGGPDIGMKWVKCQNAKTVLEGQNEATNLASFDLEDENACEVENLREPTKFKIENAKLKIKKSKEGMKNFPRKESVYSSGEASKDIKLTGMECPEFNGCPCMFDLYQNILGRVQSKELLENCYQSEIW